MRQKIGIVTAWIIFLGILISAYRSSGGKILPFQQQSKEIEVSFLETNNDADCIIIHHGDCIIIHHGDRAIMIDTAERIDGSHVIEEIKEKGIKVIDYLILTHPDYDHIGSALEILEEVDVLKVVQPYYTGEEKPLYQKLQKFCDINKIPVFYPAHAWKVRTDYAEMIVYPPLEKNYKDTNNLSLAVLLKHKEVDMFFAGDALRKRTEELLKMNLPQVDLYKVAHHGRANSASKKILLELKPEYAVVTSGFADREIIEQGEAMGTQFLFTNDGDITFRSDGDKLTVVK